MWLKFLEILSNVSRQLDFTLSSFLLSKFRKILYFISSKLASRWNFPNPANWLAPRAGNFFLQPNCLLTQGGIAAHGDLICKFVCCLWMSESCSVILNAHITYSSLRCKSQGGGKLFCTYLISNYLPQYISSPLHRNPAWCDTPWKDPAILLLSTGISLFHTWKQVYEFFYFSLVGKAVAAPHYTHQPDQVFYKMPLSYDLVEVCFLTKVKEIAGVNVVVFLRAHIKKYL